MRRTLLLAVALIVIPQIVAASNVSDLGPTKFIGACQHNGLTRKTINFYYFYGGFDDTTIPGALVVSEFNQDKPSELLASVFLFFTGEVPSGPTTQRNISITTQTGQIIKKTLVIGEKSSFDLDGKLYECALHEK